MASGAFADQPVTYEPVGVTLRPSLLRAPPRGFRTAEASVRLGDGAARFTAASADLMAWQVLLRSGVSVTDAAAGVALGVTAVQRLPFLGIGVAAPIRVVRVIGEPERTGYLAGTLAGHPLRGEEAFVVEHRADDSVWLVIRAAFRPSTALHAVLWPGILLLRQVYVARYLNALCG